MSTHRASRTTRPATGARPRRRWALGAVAVVACTGATWLSSGAVAETTASSRDCTTQPALERCEPVAPAPGSVPPPGPEAAVPPPVSAGTIPPAAPPSDAPPPAAAGPAAPESPAAETAPSGPTAPGSPARPVVVPPPAGAASLDADSGRPFAASSAWNTPLPDAPVLDPESAAMVAAITPEGRAYANLYEFGEPVFTADASTPTATVDCTMTWGDCALEGRRLRIPAEARPTTGSDGRMIVVDLVDRTSCDFWQARRIDATRWTTSWGTCADLDGDGRATTDPGGATGAGVNALTGVVRTFEMRDLAIPHALSVATNNSCRGEFRYPAKGTDGLSARSDCIPEGARLQLDPSIDVDAIPGITPGEKAVARALQTYGAINRDNAGAPLVVQFETPIGEGDPYPAAGFPWDYYDMPHIPWDRLQVLRSWDGT